MAIKYDPDTEQFQLPPETSPRRSRGWFGKLQQRVKLALAGSDDELLLENKTGVSWRVYHDYHQLGIVDAGEQRMFKMVKRGSFSVRPSIDGEDVEYLVLQLDQRVRRVYIYQRRIGQAVEVYDMRAA